MASATAPSDSGALSLLGEREGYLVVHSAGAAAGRGYVYLGGLPVGPVAQQLRVPCGVAHVRIGTFPEHGWLSPGHAVGVKCRDVTEVTIELPEPARAGSP